MTHQELKIAPEFFDAKIAGLKPWEWRAIGDRHFPVGGTITFREWNPETTSYTGREYGPVTITYRHDPTPGFCIFTHSTYTHEDAP